MNKNIIILDALARKEGFFSLGESFAEHIRSSLAGHHNVPINFAVKNANEPDRLGEILPFGKITNFLLILHLRKYILLKDQLFGNFCHLIQLYNHFFLKL